MIVNADKFHAIIFDKHKGNHTNQPNYKHRSERN